MLVEEEVALFPALVEMGVVVQLIPLELLTRAAVVVAETHKAEKQADQE
jgi:hypothetical protein